MNKLAVLCFNERNWIKIGVKTDNSGLYGILIERTPNGSITATRRIDVQDLSGRRTLAFKGGDDSASFSLKEEFAIKGPMYLGMYPASKPFAALVKIYERGTRANFDTGPSGTVNCAEVGANEFLQVAVGHSDY